MLEYTVVSLNPKNRLVALRDSDGCFHVGRCTGAMPGKGDVLSGGPPAIGFSLLKRSDGGIYRYIFKEVNGVERWALELLQHDDVETRAFTGEVARLPRSFAVR